ncbi:MAG: hypothetical protein QME79_05815 [Bacillota bacterium]|nr:hypothetical protein [Bacillota bacterium]
MKGKLASVLSLFLALSLATPCFALSDVSFRLLGMGKGLAGIVDDEYTDFNLFPALVVDMKGTTLFTNLGNLGEPVQTLDQNLDSAEYDFANERATNVVGLVTELANGKAGFLYEHGAYDFTANASSEGKYIGTTWTDTYQYQYKDTESGSLSDLSAFYGLTLGNGVKIGARMGQVNAKHGETWEWGYSGDEQGTGYHDTYRYLNLSDGSDSASTLRLEVGAQLASGDWTIDLSGKLLSEKAETEYVDKYSWDETWLTDEYWNYLYSDEYSYTANLPTYGLMGRASKPATLFGQDAVVRLFAGATTGSGSIDGSDLYKYNNSDSSGYKYLYTYEHDLSGDISANTYTLGGGYQVALGEETTLGLGLKALSGKSKTIWKQGGGVATVDDNGTKTVIEHNDPQETTVESEYLQVSIPVGLEHRLTDRLTLRLGSEAFLVNKENYSIKWKGTDAPNTVNGTQLPGDVYEYSEEYSGESSNTKAVYTAGIGYRLSDNIQLDAVHVTNLVDLRNWLISATIKF